MSLLHTSSFGRTLDALVGQYSQSQYAGTQIEAWLFEDGPSRRAAEQRLADAGVTAIFRSAYKPLLHHFLEQIERETISDIVVRYPLHKAAGAKRFRLETYPLAALVGDSSISFEGFETHNFNYEIAYRDAGGLLVEQTVFAPNRIAKDHIGQTVASPTGWLKITLDGKVSVDEPLITDYQLLFADALSAIASHDWSAEEPHFEELNIAVGLPGVDLDLGFGDEMVSLHEGMHEDLYFSLLEMFQLRSGRALGDRGLKPGQIVPEIFHSERPHLVISEKPLVDVAQVCAVVSIDTTPIQPGVEQILDELSLLGGTMFEARSRSDRPVWGVHRPGTDKAVMISGGQHPNETSGIVGALRAAKVLARDHNANFTVSPLENPDGYALHQRLCATNPHHMHHAARYTALGDDLEYREAEPFHERGVRNEAFGRTSAQLHVNLHGYPAHEWTRPLSGYVPRGFEMWTLPKGFFLIMRHHADSEDRGRALIDAVTRHLTGIEGLVAFNNAQIALYEIHAGETGFEIINGFPCMISVDTRHASPLTLITEYPDETIYGDAYIKAHTAQMETVLSAYKAFQTLIN